MKNTTCKSWYFIVAALGIALLVASPLAAQPTTPFYLNGAGSGANLAGVYTSPYSGGTTPSATAAVICDDFADESYVPESWTAYVTQLPTLSNGPLSYLKWSGATVGATTLSQAAAYTVAAVLATDILTSTTGSQTQEDYSYALWELFDYTDAYNQLIAYGDVGDASNAQSYLNAAVTNVETNHLTPNNYANVTIYSYDTGATGACGGPCPAPQEFITVNMAEPSSPALLGFDLLCVAGLVFFVHRRFAGSVKLT
jgi:hypothetical protein